MILRTDGQLDPALIAARDKDWGTNTGVTRTGVQRCDKDWGTNTGGSCVAILPLIQVEIWTAASVLRQIYEMLWLHL